MSRTTRGGLIGRFADEFDLTWRDRPPADIEAFYRTSVGGSGRALDPSGRLALLVELVRIDLEYRWRPADKVRARWMVADYVRRFAELQAGGWDTVSLMADEFRVRWQWGDKPDRAKFVADHAHLEPHLTPALAGVERSLGVKSTPRPSATPTELPSPDATRARPPSTPAVPPPDSAHSRPPAVVVVPPPRPAHGKAAPPLPANVAGYEIRRELGRGGMGVVYEAWDPSLKRSAALKLILSGSHAGAEEVARFHKEAQAVAKLKHPNVVQILQFGEHDGRPFFALEYIAGGTLAQALRAGPQPVNRVVAVVLALAEGVAAAHAAGIVHRDLKPGNVLLDGPPGDTATAAPPVPKITDFGLVKDLEDDGDRTHNGRVMGTPEYMAPEQAEGRIDDIGPPADVYALGVILYEMLVGRTPLRGASTAETLELVRKKDPVPPRQLQPSVPFDLETICLKCLRKDPHQRYETAEELADDLKRYQAGRPILARPVGLAEQAWKFYRRNPIVVWTAAGVFALLLLATGAAVIAAAASNDRATAVQMQSDAERGKEAAERGKLESDLKEAQARVTISAQNADLLIGAAERELTNGDVAQAERYLEVWRAETEKGGPPTDPAWEWKLLTRRCDGDRAPLAGHTAGLWAVAVHPNGGEAATAAIDGSVRLWDLNTGKDAGEFRGHAQTAATALAATEKGLGKSLPVAAAKSLWELTSDNMDRVSGGLVGAPPFVPIDLPKHISPVLRVAYSPDGTLLASGGLEPNIDSTKLAAAVAAGTDPKTAANPTGVVRVWKRQGGREVGRQFQHKTIVTAVAFHPDGQRVASAGLDDDHAWKLWGWEKDGAAVSFAGHAGVISQVRFNRDGSLAATGSTDGTAIVWDVAAGRPKHTFSGHHATVHDLAFSPDGRRLATAGMDGTVRVWDLDHPSADPEVRRGHIGAALGVAFSGDGKRLASAGFDRTVRVWDPAPAANRQNDREKLTLRGHTEAVWGVAFDRDDRLVSAAFDQTARVWDATPPQPVGRVLVRNTPAAPDEDHRVNRLAYSPTGDRLVTAGWDRTATLRDAATGAVLRTFTHDGPVWGAAFSPDGNRLVTGSWDGTVRLWDANTGQELGGEKGTPFAKLSLPVQSVAFGRTGQVVAAGTWDGTVKVWDAATGQARHTFTDHLLPVYDLAFGPGDKHLASAGGDRKAVVRSLADGRKAEVKEHTATVFRVAFDRDGGRLAVGSWDRRVSVWDFDPRRTTVSRAAAFDAHADYVNGLAFRPDGKRLATVGNDRTVREWDLSGRPAGDVRTLRGVVWDVAYAPTGDKLAVAVWNPRGWVREVPAAR